MDRILSGMNLIEWEELVDREIEEMRQQEENESKNEEKGFVPTAHRVILREVAEKV